MPTNAASCAIAPRMRSASAASASSALGIAPAGGGSAGGRAARLAIALQEQLWPPRGAGRGGPAGGGAAVIEIALQDQLCRQPVADRTARRAAHTPFVQQHLGRLG